MSQQTNHRPDESLSIIRRKQHRQQSSQSSRLRRFFRWKYLASAAAVFILILWIIAYYIVTPSVSNTPSEIFQTSIIYDRTGQIPLYELYGEENRKIISHEEIPDYMRISSIVAEDNNFYLHRGIDPKGILRSIKANVETSELQQGGSTITQQLARNVFLSREKTFKRKILEVILAIKLENNFSKDEILDMYLNAVPYGSNAYGIQSASKIFFGKDANDLTLDEAALLAALPNATTYFSPYGSHTDELVKKQQKILDRTAELKLADKNTVEEAKKINTLEKVVPLKKTILAPHFVFYVKDCLEKKYGADFLKKGGLKIYTSLDMDKQNLAENVIESKMPEMQRRYGATNAALTALDPKTGEILAMVGSRDYFNETIDGKVNVATSLRQPGSSFKPFAYAAAFEAGYQPETLLYDVPTSFGPDGTGKDYTPQNYDGSFHGLVSMRQSLVNSLNIPAVKTLYLAGIKNTIDLATRMGISSLTDEKRFGLALVLGGGEVTLLDETSAYSTFANDGVRNEVNPVLKITDTQDDVIFELKTSGAREISQEIARKINSVLSDNNARSLVFGTRSNLYIPGKTVAAKTGTTQEFRDAWTVGYTTSIVCGVWAGNSDNTAMRNGADGVYVAAPIWNAFMSKTLESYPNETFAPYEQSQIQKVLASASPKIEYVNKHSGKKISKNKLDKTDADKIEVRVILPNYPGLDSLLVPENTTTNDPMIQRWQESLKNPDGVSAFKGKKDENNKDNND